MSQLVRVAVFAQIVVQCLASQPLPFLVDVSCALPTCATEADRARLWPFRDPNFFVICQPPQWHLIRRPCLNGTLFHYGSQQCVHPSQWEKPCAPTPSLPQCPQVICQTIQDQTRLWPEEDPNFFLQCIPAPAGGMMAVRRPCASGFRFSFSLQLCVDAQFWEPDCVFEDEIETTELPSTTTTTALPTTTTTELPPTTTELPTTTTTTTTTELLTTTTELPTTTTELPTTTTTTTELPTTTGLPGPITTTEPARGICPVPICSFQDPTLYPHSDWTKFYQCVANEFGYWLPMERPCGAGTFFHGGFQFCVNRWEWEDFCL